MTDHIQSIHHNVVHYQVMLTDIILVHIQDKIHHHIYTSHIHHAWPFNVRSRITCQRVWTLADRCFSNVCTLYSSLQTRIIPKIHTGSLHTLPFGCGVNHTIQKRRICKKRERNKKSAWVKFYRNVNMYCNVLR